MNTLYKHAHPPYRRLLTGIPHRIKPNGIRPTATPPTPPLQTPPNGKSIPHQTKRVSNKRDDGDDYRYAAHPVEPPTRRDGRTDVTSPARPPPYMPNAANHTPTRLPGCLPAF